MATGTVTHSEDARAKPDSITPRTVNHVRPTTLLYPAAILIAMRRTPAPEMVCAVLQACVCAIPVSLPIGTAVRALQVTGTTLHAHFAMLPRPVTTMESVIVLEHVHAT